LHDSLLKLFYDKLQSVQVKQWFYVNILTQMLNCLSELVHKMQITQICVIWMARMSFVSNVWIDIEERFTSWTCSLCIIKSSLYIYKKIGKYMLMCIKDTLWHRPLNRVLLLLIPVLCQYFILDCFCIIRHRHLMVQIFIILINYKLSELVFPRKPT